MDAGGRRSEPDPRIPADLSWLLVAVVATVGVVFTPGVRETPIRVIVGLPFLLFVPGYAFVAALYPEAGGAVPAADSGWSNRDDDGASSPPSEQGRSGIDAVERVALSVGASIVLVPAVAFLLTVTPWGLREWTVVAAISLVTVAGVAVATRRRRQLPRTARFSVPYRQWVSNRLERRATPRESLLTVVLVVSLLLAAGSVGYVVAVPAQPDPYTELYLLTEDEDGDLTATDYPTNLTTGESASLTLVVANQERESITYAIVVLLQEVRTQNGSVTVEAEHRLDQFSVDVPHNSSQQVETTVSPTRTGSALRLVFLLYKTTPPPDPTVDDAYRAVHLRINVRAPSVASRVHPSDAELSGPAVTQRLGPR